MSTVPSIQYGWQHDIAACLGEQPSNRSVRVVSDQALQAVNHDISVVRVLTRERAPPDPTGQQGFDTRGHIRMLTEEPRQDSQWQAVWEE